MDGRFPEVLLPDVLEFLDIESLLLCAMPVSKYWREQACGHPTYWRDLKYTGRDGIVEISGPELYAASVPSHERSLDLFFLRLSRTYARPIDIEVCRPDPHVLTAIAPHLPHVRRLSIDVVVRYWEGTIDILRRTPAPILEFLFLNFQYNWTSDSDRQFHPVLPSDLFSGEPAPLKDVRLSNVGLLSITDLPACFSGITTLVVYNTHPSVHRSLPNLFRHCPRLRTLWLYFRVTLEDPEFRKKETWRGLDELGLHCLDSWEALALPLTNIPYMRMAPGSAPHAIEVISWFGPRLTLEVPPLQPGIERSNSRHFYTVFEVFGDTSSRRRLVQMRFPGNHFEPPERLALTALQDAVVSGRIVELTLAAHNWELFVGKRYLSAFPALKRLTLGMTQASDATSFSRAADATLSCPQLSHLVLAAYPEFGAVTLDSTDLCNFARAALIGAPFPVRLEFDNVALTGSFSEMGDLFEHYSARGSVLGRNGLSS